MIGREISGYYYRSDEQESHQGEVVLRVQDLSTEKLKNISFELYKGEILAICGLSDAGTNELGKAICGFAEYRTGEVTDVKTGKSLNKPQDIIRAKGAYLSKDRDEDGLMLNASVKEWLLCHQPGF